MEVRVIPYILHFKRPAGTSRGIYTERKVWYIEISDVCVPQRKGIGECAPLPDLSCDYAAEQEGQYVAVIEEVCRLMRGVVPDSEGNISIPADVMERLRACPSVLFGLETAVWHYNAGSTALSATAFGRGERGIQINGLIWMGSFDEMKERIEEKLRSGFTCVKLKIGAINFDDELNLLKMIRRRYSRSVIELRVDANGAFAPGDDAMRKLEALSKLGLHSIEQPIKAGQYAEMARICRETPLPVALDEELIGVNAVRETEPMTKTELLETVNPQYIILKPSLHGGLYGAEEWIQEAEKRNIGWWVTSALESNVGLNSIAHWCALLQEGRSFYGGVDVGVGREMMPQGLGTGQLFTDNVAGYPLQIIGDRLWYGFK